MVVLVRVCPLHPPQWFLVLFCFVSNIFFPSGLLPSLYQENTEYGKQSLANSNIKHKKQSISETVSASYFSVAKCDLRNKILQCKLKGKREVV